MGRRVALLAAALALPLAALALLLAVPRLDVRWEHHPSHFWLVLAVAALNVALGLVASEAASRRDDSRTFFVSLALLASAGFLGLHALATPGVLLDQPNAGFAIATPVGLLLAAWFAAVSALEVDHPIAHALARHRLIVRASLGIAVAAWGVASLAQVPFLDRPLAPDDAPLPLRLMALLGVGLYGFAAVRYVDLVRRRRRPLPLAVLVAFVLLAEAMIAVTFARSWHATWWEWHILMAIAFGAVVGAARLEYRREGSLTAVFGGIYLDSTLRRLDRRSAERLSELVEALRSGRPIDPILERLRGEGMSREETEVLDRSARELLRVDELFRPYVAPPLAKSLERRPELAQLGGEEREVSVLFADLAGFTAFSEQREASEVVAMLNGYWGATVPTVVEDQGGLIERFAGDAILVVFNAIGEQPDHALVAVRAALAMQEEAERLAAAHPQWPRFRIGVNSGPAVVGNVGAGAHRSFSAIGDATNVAARLQATARPGEIVLGPATYAIVRDRVEVLPLGPAELKGKREAVERYRLVSLRG